MAGPKITHIGDNKIVMEFPKKKKKKKKIQDQGFQTGERHIKGRSKFKTGGGLRTRHERWKKLGGF